VGAASSTKTLAEHWDGMRWRVVPSPSPGSFGDQLLSVAAASSTDAWAVGRVSTTQFGDRALVEHWDGARWRVVPTPTIGIASELRGVSVVSTRDIWAVGLYYVPSEAGTLTLTLTEHWDGHAWRVVPSPSPTQDDLLDSVSVLSSHDVWAVGRDAGENLAVHWDGSSWSTVPTPFRPGTIGFLWAVSADSHAGVWAAGVDINTTNYTDHTVVMHDCALPRR
jgi:hypothetical protein